MHRFHFPIVIIDEDYRSENTSGLGIRALAAAIEKDLLAGKFKVAAIERKESKQRPSAPFITSRLQQEAARKFSYSVKRTMGIA